MLARARGTEPGVRNPGYGTRGAIPRVRGPVPGRGAKQDLARPSTAQADTLMTTREDTLGLGADATHSVAYNDSATVISSPAPFGHDHCTSNSSPRQTLVGASRVCAGSGAEVKSAKRNATEQIPATA